MGRLKELREETKSENCKPISQAKVAEAIGCDEATYNQWETGKKELQKIEFAKKLAEFYGVSVDYILGGDYRKNENENICEELGLSEKAIDRIIELKADYLFAKENGLDDPIKLPIEVLQLILESDKCSELLHHIGKFLILYLDKTHYTQNIEDDNPYNPLKYINLIMDTEFLEQAEINTIRDILKDIKESAKGDKKNVKR